MSNFPAYKNGSLVNLMSSIAVINGVELAYPQLSIFPDIKKNGFDKIVHIILDGLGYDYLMEFGKNSFLEQHITGRFTSVFPTTTAAALTTIASGLAPGEHGITGWYMRLEGNKIKNPAVILPYHERGSEISLLDLGFKPETIFPAERIVLKQNKCRTIIPVEYQNSVYNNFMLHGSKNHYYKNISDFFLILNQLINDNQTGYIYAYLPHFDDVFHHEGEQSVKLKTLFDFIDSNLAKIAAEKNSNTLLVINSDHGLIDNQPEKCLKLHDFPKIAEMLDFPLCGEARMIYCFVKEEFKSIFKNTVISELGDICEIISFNEAIDKNLFGLYQNHPRLAERTGDFLILMNEGYALKDSISDKPIEFHKADHGGLTCKEIYIPLIVV